LLGKCSSTKAFECTLTGHEEESTVLDHDQQRAD
jgi:hypothetical protein